MLKMAEINYEDLGNAYGRNSLKAIMLVFLPPVPYVFNNAMVVEKTVKKKL